MPRDEAVRQPSRHAPIKLPEQLQQAKRPVAPGLDGGTSGQRAAGATPPQDAGVLGQLRTERAHD